MMTAAELAQEYNLAEIEFRLAILNSTIQAAIRDGDERWKTALRPQAELLNEARGLLLRSSGRAGADQAISITPGVLGARGELNHG